MSLNLYRVVLGKGRGCIKVSSYVVTSASEELATFGPEMRRGIHEWVTHYSRYESEPPTYEKVLDEMHCCEMPLTREEMDACPYTIGAPLREIESVEVIAYNTQFVDGREYTEGQIHCCDYYPG